MSATYGSSSSVNSGSSCAMVPSVAQMGVRLLTRLSRVIPVIRSEPWWSPDNERHVTLSPVESFRLFARSCEIVISPEVVGNQPVESAGCGPCTGRSSMVTVRFAPPVPSTRPNSCWTSTPVTPSISLMAATCLAFSGPSTISAASFVSARTAALAVAVTTSVAIRLPVMNAVPSRIAMAAATSFPIEVRICAMAKRSIRSPPPGARQGWW